MPIKQTEVRLDLNAEQAIVGINGAGNIVAQAVENVLGAQRPLTNIYLPSTFLSVEEINVMRTIRKKAFDKLMLDNEYKEE